MYRVIGAILIILGLYGVLWGKNEEKKFAQQEKPLIQPTPEHGNNRTTSHIKSSLAQPLLPPSSENVWPSCSWLLTTALPGEKGKKRRKKKKKVLLYIWKFVCVWIFFSFSFLNGFLSRREREKKEKKKKRDFRGMNMMIIVTHVGPQGLKFHMLYMLIYGLIY